jgi:integrase
MQISRAELHRLVWTKSMVKAARELRCSNVYVARLCRLHRVPLPARGYWNRAVGARRLPPLPPTPPNGSDMVWIGEGATRRLANARQRKPVQGSVRPWITRQELHEAVHSSSLAVLAETWRLAAADIRAICTRLGVVLPASPIRHPRKDTLGTNPPPLAPALPGTPQRARLAPTIPQARAVPVGRDPNIRVLVGAYLTQHVARKSAAPATAKHSANRLVAHFGDMRPRDVKPRHVDDYVERRTTGMLVGAAGRIPEAATVRRELAVLVAALNHAFKEGYIPKADLPSIRLPPGNQPRQRWLNDEDLGWLFAAAKDNRGNRLSRVERFVYLAFYTAGRKAAIEELEWSQVDLDTNMVHLQKQGATETKKRRASVPMHPALREILERAYAERLTLAGGEPSPWVLDAPLTIRTAFRNLVAQAGLPDITPHTLRHTAATHMLRHDVAPWRVAGILGNSVAMVERVYGHHIPSAMRDAVNTLGDWSRGAGADK